MKDENEHRYYNFFWLDVIRLNYSETIGTKLFTLTKILFYYVAAVTKDYLTPLAGRWFPSLLLLDIFLFLTTLYVDCGNSGPVTWASRWWGSLGQECWRIKPLHRKLHNFIRFNPVPINKLKPFQMDDLQRRQASLLYFSTMSNINFLWCYSKEFGNISRNWKY